MNEKSNEILQDFQAEIDLLNKEMDDIDQLYDDLSSHFQSIKNSQFRGSLVFVQNQTRSLIELKSLKMNLIKERGNVKKTVYDLAFKNEKNNNETEANKEFVTSIMNELRKTMDAKVESTDDYEEPFDDSDLDNLTIDMENDAAVLASKNENIPAPDEVNSNIPIAIEDEKVLEEQGIYYCTTDKKFYELNDNFELVKDLGTEYAKVLEIYNPGTESEVAFCDNGKFYSVIEIEDEE